MSKYISTKLGHISRFKQGVQIPVDEQLFVEDESNVRFIRIVNYTQKDSDFRYIDRKYANNCVSEEDIVVVRYGSIGTIGRGYSGVIANNLFQVIPNDQIDKNYLYYYLTSSKSQNYLRSQVKSGAMPALSFKIVEQLPIQFPESLEEQKKIAQILSTWDEAIEATGELIEKKTLVLKRYYQELIRGDLYRESSKKLKLKDLFDRVREKNVGNNDNVLTISAQFGLVSQLDYFNKDVSGKSLLGYYFIKNGDFAYNRSYSNGYPLGAIKRLDSYSEGVVSTLYLCFRPKKDKEINSDFYMHFFEAGGLNREISKIAQEGARNHGLLNVSVTDFFDVELHFPSIKEQNDISNMLNLVNTEIELLKTKKSLFEKQKKGLMQKLLTGKVRVN